jgi:hypothetical protein
MYLFYLTEEETVLFKISENHFNFFVGNYLAQNH